MQAIHGNKSQNARQAALNAFKSGNARVLVATDIASRGIDVPGISHVINYELPNEPEAYVHRIGRTARAGKEGFAISFCDPAERAFLKQIERLTKVQLTIATHDLPAAAPDSQRPSQPRKESARKDEPRRDRGHRTEGRRDEQRRDERPRFEKPRFDKPRGDALRDVKSAQEVRAARPEADGERKPRSNRPGAGRGQGCAAQPEFLKRRAPIKGRVAIPGFSPRGETALWVGQSRQFRLKRTTSTLGSPLKRGNAPIMFDD